MSSGLTMRKTKQTNETIFHTCEALLYVLESEVKKNGLFPVPHAELLMVIGDIFIEGWRHCGLSIYTIVSDIKNFI